MTSVGREVPVLEAEMDAEREPRWKIPWYSFKVNAMPAADFQSVGRCSASQAPGGAAFRIAPTKRKT